MQAQACGDGILSERSFWHPVTRGCRAEAQRTHTEGCWGVLQSHWCPERRLAHCSTLHCCWSEACARSEGMPLCFFPIYFFCGIFKWFKCTQLFFDSHFKSINVLIQLYLLRQLGAPYEMLVNHVTMTGLQADQGAGRAKITQFNFFL